MENIKCYRMNDLKEIEVLVEGVLESWCKTVGSDSQFKSVYSVRNDMLLKLDIDAEVSSLNSFCNPKSKDFEPGDLIFVISEIYSGPVFVSSISEPDTVWFVNPGSTTLHAVTKDMAILLSKSSSNLSCMHI